MAIKFDPKSLKIVKRVTLPLWKWSDDVPKFMAILPPGVFKGKELKGTKEGAIMEPADLANVINLETGEECQIIVNAVLASQWRENYGEANKVVGKAFAVTRHAKEKGKRYNEFEIIEIENPLTASLAGGTAPKV